MSSQNVNFLAPSIMESLKILSNDFDSFGLPGVKVTNSVNNVIMQLIDSTNLLMQQYRKSLTQVSNLNLSIKEVQSRQTSLNKLVNKYEIDLEDKELKITETQQKLTKSEFHSQSLQKENDSLKINVNLLKKQSKSFKENSEHQIQKLEHENEKLIEQLTKRVGTFTSSNDVISKEIKKFKDKEQIYKETILSLERNNSALLEEILNLKEEVVEMIRNKQFPD